MRPIKAFIHAIYKKSLLVYFFYSILCEILTLVWMLAEPSDAENQFLWGFSLNRWLLLLLVLFCVVASTFLLYISISRRWFYPALSAFFEFPSETVSPALFLMVILAGGAFLISFAAIFPNRFLIARLRPVGLMLCLFLAGAGFYDIFFCGHRPWAKIGEYVQFVLQKISHFSQKLQQFVLKSFSGYRFLGYVMALSFPLLFFAAFTYSYPGGYAGLYTLMSEKVVESGFRLPQSVPYYGPGGMPFAYPPAGFFMMAFFTSILHIPRFVYLRFAPPVFMWLSMIPLSLLTRELTKSRVAAVVAAIIVAGAQRIFIIQGNSGGIVRGLAFMFALFGIYFYLLSMKSEKGRRFAVISGIFFGLTVLTHLSYAEFAAFFVAAYLLSHLNSKNTWPMTVVAGGVTLCLIAPWIDVMIQRYGWRIFEGAFQSHGNNYFLSLWQDPQKIIPWVENSLRPIYKMQFVWGILILGLVFAFIRTNKVLPVWFGLLLVFTSEGDRYLICVSAILIGLIVSVINENLCRMATEAKFSWKPILFVAVVVAVFYQYGWNNITSANVPVINAYSVDMAEYIRNHTPEKFTYLIVADADEAEWFPYLLRRVPAVASWGGEWIGTYNQNLGWLMEINTCQQQESVSGLENVMRQLPEKPDLLITHADKEKLNHGLKHGSWNVMYQNKDYILWGRN